MHRSQSGEDDSVSHRHGQSRPLSRGAKSFLCLGDAASRIIFIAGQTALDRDGSLIGKNDFAVQAEQVFRNLSFALQASGCTASNLVKLTVFLTDMDNLTSYRDARNQFFACVTPPAAPAVTLVEVSKLYGPDFMIEIEAIAAG